MNIRRMRPDEIDSAVSVWREANIARKAPRGPERTARIREKLSASEALPFVALRPGVVGIALDALPEPLHQPTGYALELLRAYLDTGAFQLR